MPSPNAIRVDTADSYYHVYARGVNKQDIFLDVQDFEYFQSLLARYLSPKPLLNRDGLFYPHYTGLIELNCYCLMNNHFHLLIYQINQGSMTGLMHSLMLSYSIYFNFKYRRTGHTFESRYKAAIITEDNHLLHISRYIHMNPKYWKNYKYSSLINYISGLSPEWLSIERVISNYSSSQDYYDFLLAYENQKRLLKEIKQELAC